MAVTQKQIANSLGISLQSVSYALSGGGTVSEQKRREILEAAHTMGYQRNELARAMVTGKSHIIGLLTYDGSGEHMATVATGVIDEAVKAGYSVKVLHVPHGCPLEQVRETARRCAAWKLDGAVAVSLEPETLAVLGPQLGQCRCPVAYVETSDTRDDMVVKTDDRSAFRGAIEHLASLGHRRIAHLSGPNHPLTYSRNALFLETLGEVGLETDAHSVLAIHHSEWANRERIEKVTRDLMSRRQRPTAVVCAGDASAMIVMRTLWQMGLSVPRDLSVIGFGNFGLGEHAYPALTTIGQPFREMGRLAAKRLIERISAPNSLSGTPSDAEGHDAHELPAHLIVRESTGPLNSTL